MATTKSKMFRVFVAGQTISDGRQITPEMIDQIVETFNAETYTPRINVEHLSGFSPEPPFNGYGDVIAVEARDVDLTIAGKNEKRHALYAQVEANDQLVALVKKDQKPFPSVELTPSYAGTDKVGLIGLAFTDKPASVGTERLKFSSRAPGTLFSYGTDAVSIDFDAKPADATGIAAAITSGLTSFFSKFSAAPEKEEQAPPSPPAPPAKHANDNFDAAAFSAAVGTAMGEQIVAAVKPVSDAVAAIDARFTALESKLSNTPDPNFSRPPAAGPGSTVLTDC